MVFRDAHQDRRKPAQSAQLPGRVTAEHMQHVGCVDDLDPQPQQAHMTGNKILVDVIPLRLAAQVAATNVPTPLAISGLLASAYRARDATRAASPCASTCRLGVDPVPRDAFRRLPRRERAA